MMTRDNARLPEFLTVSDARSRLYDIIDEANVTLRRFILTHHGKPTAVILSLNDLEGLEETIDIMSNPKLVRDIKEGERDRKAGRVYTLEEVEKRLGIYENRSNGQSSKRTRKTASARIKKGLQKNKSARVFASPG